MIHKTTGNVDEEFRKDLSGTYLNYKNKNAQLRSKNKELMDILEVAEVSRISMIATCNRLSAEIFTLREMVHHPIRTVVKKIYSDFMEKVQYFVDEVNYIRYRDRY